MALVVALLLLTLCVSALLLVWAEPGDGDVKALVVAGYNRSELAKIRSQKMKISKYYAVGAPTDHRAAVGGKWDEVGELQLRFLRSRGLKPSHTLLDLGCGSLRAGVHLVRYLEPSRYYGVDLNPHLISAGYTHELAPLGLTSKLPREHLAASASFSATGFGVRFDYVLAHSVWTHLPIDEIGRCLQQVHAVLAPEGRFYATFHVVPENASLATPIVQHAPRTRHDPPAVTTHGDRDFFHHHASAIGSLAKRARLRMRRL